MSRQQELASRDNSSPSTENESQDLEIDREITVLINGKRYTLLDDDGDLEIRNKLNGMGISIQQNGDIMMLTGSGGNGKACGGRFLVNAKGGGMFKYDGPKIEVASAKSDSPTEGEESTTTEESGRTGLASSTLLYGDGVTECHGHVTIKATNITLEAADVLSLVGKGSVLLQAGPNGGGDLQLHAGQITEAVDTKISVVEGQEAKVASEEVSLQYDPRASVNVVSPGHMNIKAKGDISFGAGGIIEQIALGTPPTPPLIKDRTNAFTVKTVAGKISIDSANLATINAAAALNFNAGAALTATAGAALGLKSVGPSTLDSDSTVAITGKGNVTVTGALIYLN